MAEELSIGLKLNEPTFGEAASLSDPTNLSDPANDDTDEQEEDEDAEHEINDDIDELDTDSDDKDYSKIYQRFQQRFVKVYETLHDLFEKEKSQRQSLTYFQQRNNALLKLIQEFDEEGQNRNTVEPHRITLEPLSMESASRISTLIQRVPRLQAKLTPLLKLMNGSELEVEKQHLINLFLNEKIPENINDDLISMETNPQDIESWCRRNYPNLVKLDFKPTDIPVKGLRAEYINSELVLNPEGVIYE